MTGVPNDLKAMATKAMSDPSVPVFKAKPQKTGKKELSLTKKRGPVRMAIRKSGKRGPTVQVFDRDSPRDATRHDINEQLRRLLSNGERIQRRLTKAAKRGERDKVSKLAFLLANTEARIQTLVYRLERL